MSRGAVRINPRKSPADRIVQKNRLFFALMQADTRGLTPTTRHRIVRALFP